MEIVDTTVQKASRVPKEKRVKLERQVTDDNAI